MDSFTDRKGSEMREELREVGYLEDLIRQIQAWPRVSLLRHPFGGTEFRLEKRELGHLHEDGTLDIPFPRAIRDELLAQGLASKHHWLPDSGWTTFRLRRTADSHQAVWLLRLSYLRYALKTAPDPRQLLLRETADLELSPRLARLFENFLPRSAGSIKNVEGARRRARYVH